MCYFKNKKVFSVRIFTRKHQDVELSKVFSLFLRKTDYCRKRHMWISRVHRNVLVRNYFYQFRKTLTTNNEKVTPKLYALQYEYVTNALEKRKPYREAHLAFIRKQVEKGNVILGGAIGDPPTGALTIFRNLSANDIEQFVRQDPYVINDIVTKYTIKPYMAIIGDVLLKNDFINI